MNKKIWVLTQTYPTPFYLLDIYFTLTCFCYFQKKGFLPFLGFLREKKIQNNKNRNSKSVDLWM